MRELDSFVDVEMRVFKDYVDGLSKDELKQVACELLGYLRACRSRNKDLMARCEGLKDQVIGLSLRRGD